MPNEKSVFDINGTQFPLHDANAVKYDRAQTLTDAQKQQARVNIGALGQASIYNGLDKQVLGFALDAYQGKVLNDSKTAVQNGLAIIVDGDTASMAVPVGSYAYIKNNVHGLSEGLYTNTSASAFPASGGLADSSVFTPVSGGGLNAIQQSLADVYSTTAVKTPAKWLNGNHIYRRVYPIDTLPNNATIQIPHGITSQQSIIAVSGLCYKKTARNQTRSLPFGTGDSNGIRIDTGPDTIYVITKADWTTYAGYVILEYVDN